MVHVTFFPSGGGGGGLSQDRFWPRYLVGNVPAGDSNTPYSVSGFDYIPDVGNGAGLAAALAAAVNDPGIVGVRRGTYDLNAPGAPAGVLSVPAGTSVVGMGPYITGGGPPQGQIVGREQGDQGVFSIDGNGAFLRDLMILVPPPPPGAVYAGSDSIVRVGVAGSGGMDNVVILGNFDAQASLLRAYFSAENSNTAIFSQCFALHFTPSRLGVLPSEWLSGFRVAQPSAVAVDLYGCAALGQDVSVRSDTPSSILRVDAFLSLGFARRGIYQSAAAPGVITVDSSSIFIASDADAMGAELYPGTSASNYGSSLQAAWVGQLAMNEPAVMLHSMPGGAGRVRLTDGFYLWSAAQGVPIIRIGNPGSPSPCDRNLVHSNHILSAGAPGDGVHISDLMNNSNSIQSNNIEVGGAPWVNNGTATQIANNV